MYVSTGSKGCGSRVAWGGLRCSGAVRVVWDALSGSQLVIVSTHPEDVPRSLADCRVGGLLDPFSTSSFVREPFLVVTSGAALSECLPVVSACVVFWAVCSRTIPPGLQHTTQWHALQRGAGLQEKVYLFVVAALQPEGAPGAPQHENEGEDEALVAAELLVPTVCVSKRNRGAGTIDYIAQAASKLSYDWDDVAAAELY